LEHPIANLTLPGYYPLLAVTALLSGAFVS